MAEVRVTLEVGNDGVAVITISNPPVNALAIPSELHTRFDVWFWIVKVWFWLRFWLPCAVLAGLKEKFTEAVRRNDVKAIVLTGIVWLFFMRCFEVSFVPFDLLDLGAGDCLVVLTENSLGNWVGDNSILLISEYSVITCGSNTWHVDLCEYCWIFLLVLLWDW